MKDAIELLTPHDTELSHNYPYYNLSRGTVRTVLMAHALTRAPPSSVLSALWSYPEPECMDDRTWTDPPGKAIVDRPRGPPPQKRSQGAQTTN